jgi:hypothetical protein
MRQPVALEVEIHRAAFGNRQGVGQRLRQLGEQLRHLLRRPQIVGRIRHAHTGRIVAHRSGLDAEQDVLQLPFLGADVVHVVGRHQLPVHPPRFLQQLPVDLRQLGDGVLLKLEKEAVAPEDLQVPIDQTPRRLAASCEQRRGSAGQAARGADEPSPCAARNSRSMRGGRSLPAGRGGNLNQIAITGVVLRQQQQVEGAVVELRVLILHTARRQISFHPDDRTQPGFARRTMEIDDAVHHAVVGQGQRRHAQGLGLRHQIRDVAEPVQHRVLGMDVKVNERHRWDGWIIARRGLRASQLPVVSGQGVTATGHEIPRPAAPEGS